MASPIALYLSLPRNKVQIYLRKHYSMILQVEMCVSTSPHYRRLPSAFWHAAPGFSGKLGDYLPSTDYTGNSSSGEITGVWQLALKELAVKSL